MDLYSGPVLAGLWKFEMPSLLTQDDSALGHQLVTDPASGSLSWVQPGRVGYGAANVSSGFEIDHSAVSVNFPFLSFFADSALFPSLSFSLFLSLYF